MVDNMILEFELRLGKERSMAIKELIELHIQPKPIWCPKYVYGFLIKHLLIIKTRPVALDKKEEV